MWETPFNVSFLYEKQGVVIRCPEESLSHDLFDILKENGAFWSDMSVTKWSANKENTAYFVKNKRILYGPYVHADMQDYCHYIKCTFYGAGADPLQDVEVSEDEFLAMLNA